MYDLVPNISSSDPVGMLRHVVTNLLDVLDIDFLESILKYHIVPGQWDLTTLKAASLVPTRLGISLSVPFPGISDVGNNIMVPAIENRQLSFRSGDRLSFISGILLPRKLIMSSKVPAVRPFSNPFLGILQFINGRSDLSLLAALLQMHPKLLYEVLRIPEKHMLAPTNHAFVDLIGDLLDNKTLSLLPLSNLTGNIDIKDLLHKVLASADDLQIVVPFAALILNIWRSLPGIPGLEGILRYHVIRSNNSFGAMRGSEWNTLKPGDKVRIAENFVIDADPSRQDARRQASYPTLSGYVSVVTRVLTPFNTKVAKAVLLGAVKSPSPTPGKSTAPLATPTPVAACFPGSAKVKTRSGWVRMRDLKEGMEVWGGRIYLFTHRTEGLYRYRKISTSTNDTVLMTGGHYLPTHRGLITARSVNIGDVLTCESGACKVTAVETEMRREGLFAPHAGRGELMVDGVLVSEYTELIKPKMAHAGLGIVRWWGGGLGQLFWEGGWGGVKTLLGGGEIE